MMVEQIPREVAVEQRRVADQHHHVAGELRQGLHAYLQSVA